MKKLFYGVLALTLMGASLISCDDDDEDYNLSQGVGDVMPYKGGSIIKVLMDDADTVLITNSERYAFDENTRVSFAGEIISERKIGDHRFYEFRAAIMDKILTKKPLLQTELDADKILADSVGNDPISLYSADIASKYLNINYTLMHGGAGQKHFINLVVNDLPTPEPLIADANGVLTLKTELRHNAFEDARRYESFGFVSFNIEDYLKIEGLKKIVFEIKYGNYKKSVEYIFPESATPTNRSLFKSKVFESQSFTESY